MPPVTYTRGFSVLSTAGVSCCVWTSISFNETFISARDSKFCNWVGSGECPHTFRLSLGRPKLYPLQIVLLRVGEEWPRVGVTDQLLRSLGLALISIFVLLMAAMLARGDPIFLWLTTSSGGEPRLGRNPTFILMNIKSSGGHILSLSADIGVNICSIQSQHYFLI